jgi:hypothetical protein
MHPHPQQHVIAHLKKGSETMFIAPVTESELKQLIRSLKNNSAAGSDEIPISLVKQCLDFLIKPLVHIYNASFQTGIFSDMMKIAKLNLCLKKDRQDMQNYRPISILSVFTKLLEKLMYNRLLSFLNKHNILISEQLGFIESRSTETASHSFIVSRKPWTNTYLW